MSSTSIQYRLPTSRSFAGMKRALFQPFDIGKWFVLGFTAWLAGLLDGGGSGGSGGSGDSSGGESGAADEFFRDTGKWVLENLALVIGIGSLVLLIVLAIIITLLWLSSRGKFMFLDNLVHDRAQVKVPWNEFRAQGNSLFRWKLFFNLIVFFGVALIVGALGMLALSLGEAAWVAIVPGIVVLLPVTLALIYITTLLEDFVIPLMYKNSLTTNEAWKNFLEIHRSSIGSFVLYVLWKALLWIAAIVCILAVGLGTFCIAFILMAIPYIGAVLLLPLSTFFRFLGPEFLRQFGSDYDVLAPAANASDGNA